MSREIAGCYLKVRLPIHFLNVKMMGMVGVEIACYLQEGTNSNNFKTSLTTPTPRLISFCNSGSIFGL